MESNKQNNLENKIDTETWNMEQTDSCQRERERGSWMKERKESAKEHKGISHGHRQPSVMGVWDIRGINSNGKSTIKNHGEKIHEVLFS